MNYSVLPNTTRNKTVSRSLVGVTKMCLDDTVRVKNRLDHGSDINMLDLSVQLKSNNL
jgi:hypothetical protein